jgi:aromatic ring-opening dioxygenase LigB subunit
MSEKEIVNCSICLNDFEKNDMCNTDCDHFFCRECLESWFNKKKTSCPMCRSEIKSYKYLDEYYKIILINKARVRREIIYRHGEDLNTIIISKNKYICMQIINIFSILTAFSSGYFILRDC